MLVERYYSPLRVVEMSFPQVEAQIRRRASLIVPVGGLEPVGPDLPLGTVNDCCDAIANEVSRRLQVTVAPLLAYANSVPFNAFGGSAGMHRDTMINIINECCKCWLFQGFKRIMILSLAMDALPAMEVAVKRLCVLRGYSDSVRCCSLQENEHFRSYCATQCGSSEHGRSEWGIRALARYLLPAGPTNATRGSAAPDAAQFKQWHRRGRDPEKLRKLAPGATLTPGGPEPDAAAGKSLFESTVTFLTKEYSPFLIAEDNASR